MKKKILLVTALICTISTLNLNAQINLKKLGKKKTLKIEQKINKKTTENTKSTQQKHVNAASTQTLFVSKTNGSNRNNGSKESPLKNIDKAIKLAENGATIKVSGGIETGTLNIGFLESDKALKIYGSWDEDFKKQNIKLHPTVIQPTNKSARSSRKALMKFTKEVDGTILDNLVFDGGERNAYHSKEGFVEGVETGRLLKSTERPVTGNATVQEPLLQFVSATKGGDVQVQNCVFVNGASFALQAGHRSGKFTVKNNVLIGNKMAAIEIYGTCANKMGPKDLSKCGEVEIAFNTIIFTWSRLKDFLDMGYGVRIMTKCSYNIHNNIIGASILAGIDHTRFNKDEWIKVNNNIFFVNKDEDLHYSPVSNTRLRVNANDFGDLEIAEASGNKNFIPKGLKVDKAYLEGYLNARYSEKTDLDRNSPANMWRSMMGMNLQGTMSSTVTMFANRYPWKSSLLLFGNVEGYGAQ